MKEAPYRIGEDVITFGLSYPYKHYNGARGMVVGELMKREFFSGTTQFSEPAYRVEFEDKQVLIIAPRGVSRPEPIRGNMDLVIPWVGFIMTTGIDPRIDPGKKNRGSDDY